MVPIFFHGFSLYLFQTANILRISNMENFVFTLIDTSDSTKLYSSHGHVHIYLSMVKNILGYNLINKQTLPTFGLFSWTCIYSYRCTPYLAVSGCSSMCSMGSSIRPISPRCRRWVSQFVATDFTALSSSLRLSNTTNIDLYNTQPLFYNTHSFFPYEHNFHTRFIESAVFNSFQKFTPNLQKMTKQQTTLDIPSNSHLCGPKTLG